MASVGGMCNVACAIEAPWVSVMVRGRPERGIAEQTRHPLLLKAGTPQNHRRLASRQLTGDD